MKRSLVVAAVVIVLVLVAFVAWWIWPMHARDAEADAVPAVRVLAPDAGTVAVLPERTQAATVQSLDEPRVSGRVLGDALGPLEGATLTRLETLDVDAVTDDEGHFELPALAATTWLVEHPQHRQAMVSPTVAQRAGRDELEIVLVGGASVSLTVVDERGEPVDGALVIWRGGSRTSVPRFAFEASPGEQFAMMLRLEGRATPMTFTNEAGRARLAGIRGEDGACLVQAGMRSRLVQGISFERGRRHVALGTVRLPDSDVLDWTVVDHLGTQLRQATVGIVCPDGELVTAAFEKGKFGITAADVPCDVAGVRVACGGYSTLWLPSVEVEPGLVFELTPQRRVRLSLVDAETLLPIDFGPRTRLRSHLSGTPVGYPSARRIAATREVDRGRVELDVDTIFSTLTIIGAHYQAVLHVDGLLLAPAETFVPMEPAPVSTFRLVDADTGHPIDRASFDVELRNQWEPRLHTNSTHLFADPDTGLIGFRRPRTLDSEFVAVNITSPGYELEEVLLSADTLHYDVELSRAVAEPSSDG